MARAGHVVGRFDQPAADADGGGEADLLAGDGPAEGFEGRGGLGHAQAGEAGEEGAELGVVPEDEPAPPVAVDLFAIGPFLRDWLEGRLPLPAPLCASTDLYSAYLHWRKKVSPGETAAINLFGGVLRRAYPAVRKTKLRFRVGGNTGLANAVVVQGAYDAVPPESRSTYAGIEIGRFAQALKDWPAQ